MKRHDDAPRARYRKLFEGIDFKKFRTRKVDAMTQDAESALHPKLEEFVAAMLEANPTLRRQEAVRYLIHTHDGRALAEHLASITKKATTMNRSDELRDIAKQFGVGRLCKYLVDDGKAHGITEHELTKLIDEEAQKTRKSCERPESAFARFHDDPENIDLRKALQIAKGFPPLMDVQPVQVGGDAVDVNDIDEALGQLQDLAAEQRRRAPTLSDAQAFARAFEANPELAAKAHRRPTPTTSFAFPR